MAFGRRGADGRGVAVGLGGFAAARVVVVFVAGVVFVSVPVASRGSVSVPPIPTWRRVSIVVVAVSAPRPAGQVVCESRHGAVM